MDILLARQEVTEKPKKISLTNLKDELKIAKDTIYYFDKDNSHKNMMTLVESLEADDYTIYFREVTR